MKLNAQKTALAASLALNALFAALFALALAASPASISFQRPGSDSMAAAAVASVPPSGSIAFNAVEIAMKVHEQASLQFSFVYEKKQANLLVSALYDPDIISVSPTGYGIVISALAEGETLMQSVSNDGIRDIALIKVLP